MTTGILFKKPKPKAQVVSRAEPPSDTGCFHPASSQQLIYQ